jgi:hypothetical protein
MFMYAIPSELRMSLIAFNNGGKKLHLGNIINHTLSEERKCVLAAKQKCIKNDPKQELMSYLYQCGMVSYRMENMSDAKSCFQKKKLTFYFLMLLYYILNRQNKMKT